MITIRALIWFAALTLAATVMLGCSPSPTERLEREYIWRQQAMVSGPSIYWTCLHGDRIYALQPLASRASNGLWPGASIAVAAGGCK